MNFSSLTRICADNNPKVVTRIYNWDGKLVEINLCENHRDDPDFDGFIEEHQIPYISSKSSNVVRT
jgi:hypothetical protein